MHWWKEQRIVRWFGLIVLLLLVNSFIAYRSIMAISANTDREIASRTVILQLEQLLSALKDAETGQRGYLLTGNPTYLEPYINGSKNIDTLIAQLKPRLAETTIQQQFPQLEALIVDRRAKLAQGITVRQTQGIDAVILLINTNNGKQLMDQIRVKIAEMEATEQAILDQRIAESRRGIQITLGTVTFATLVSVVLLVLIGYIVYRDLTARQRATEMLRQQREWFEVTLASIGDAVIATDTSSAITFMNQVAEDLTGWRTDEAQGTPAAEVFRIINEYTREPVESPIGEVLRRNGIVGLANHTILIGKDGTERSIDDSGAPIRDSQGRIIGVVLIFRDISARRRMESDKELIAQLGDGLASSLNQSVILDILVDHLVPQVADICFVDLLNDGKVERTALTYNPQPHQSAMREVLEQHKLFDNVYTSEQIRQLDEPILAAHVTDDMLDRIVSNREHGAILRSLGIRSLILVPLESREQSLGMLTLIGVQPRRSFTEQDLQLAEDLAHRAALALDTSRLYKAAQDAARDREQFLSIAAHELRTPLTSLLGRAELLQRRMRGGGLSGERDTRSVQVIVEQAKRLNNMMSTLLDLSRIQMGHFVMESTSIDLAKLMHRLVDEFEPTMERHTLEYHNSVLSLIVSGDELRLEQVIVNLLQNAVKYSPNGGTVRVVVEQQNDSAAISISDEGIGIPAQALANLFQRFYRAPNTAYGNISGMGIGLYVVKEIVDLHGGSISVASVEGQGSTFTVTLPLINDKATK